jgi:hypothetical protein
MCDVCGGGGGDLTPGAADASGRIAHRASRIAHRVRSRDLDNLTARQPTTQQQPRSVLDA